MSGRISVTALVVTYNRKDLLVRCLDAILAQTVRPSHILVINNCSTDGTEALFAEDGPYAPPYTELVTTDRNVGGAGGFSLGVRLTAGSEADAVWLMDDDTVPAPDALAELLRAWETLQDRGEHISFLASSVFGPAGEPMNVPVLQDKRTRNGYPDWYRYLPEGCAEIREASFVSLLIPCGAVQKVGLPIAGYFLWGDDTEYTRRLVRDAGRAFLCGRSRVTHLRAGSAKISVFREKNRARVPIYAYYYRNALYNSQKYERGWKTAARFCSYLGLSFTNFFRRGERWRFAKFAAMQKGCFQFLFRKMSANDDFGYHSNL